MDSQDQKRVSSPIATGGEGVFFEQHVAAYWLAQLLVRSIPPILTDTGVTEVHFQTEHLGFNTDDFLVVCARAGAANARLVGQVKLSFTISASDNECTKAIGDFWKDFKKADPFNPEYDRFVLVTLRGTNTLLENFVGLLDCARGAADGVEFERRLLLDGFISKKSSHQCNELCKIVSKLDGAPVTAKDLWPFLSVLHVLSLDLHIHVPDRGAHQNAARLQVNRSGSCREREDRVGCPSDLRERGWAGRTKLKTRRPSSRACPGTQRGGRERAARIDGTEEPH